MKAKTPHAKIDASLTKRINASIEAQMIALSEREKKGNIRLLDAKEAEHAGDLSQRLAKGNVKNKRKKMLEQVRQARTGSDHHS